MEVASGKRQNWLYFAGVFIGLSLVSIAISYVVVLTLDIDPPTVLGLIVFYLTAHLSGKRYAAATNQSWTRSDRHRLAVSYVVIATVLSFVLAGPFFIVPELGGGMIPWSEPVFLVIATIGMLLVVMAEYGIARWAFGEIMKRAPKAGDVK